VGFAGAVAAAPSAALAGVGPAPRLPKRPGKEQEALTICQPDRCFNLMEWIHAALSFRAVKFRYNGQNPPQASTLLPFYSPQTELKSSL